MRGAWRRSIPGYRGGAMQDLGYELRRIPIPRTWVNKGMKKEKKGRDIVAPSSLVLKSTGLWPLKALKAQSQPGATLPILEHFTLPERTSCPIGALAREPLWTGRCN